MPHSFQHTHAYSAAIALSTGATSFLFAVKHRDTDVACPLIERQCEGHLDIATPSGLAGFIGAGDTDTFESRWSQFVQSRGYVSAYVGLHPLYHAQIQHFPGIGSAHNSIYVLDLAPGLEEIHRRLSRNRKRELRGWERRAREFVTDRDEISEFLRVNYEPFMRERNVRGPYLTPAALDLLCQLESCLVVGTRSNGRLVAAHAFGVTQYAGEHLLNISTNEGRADATDLIWYGIDALIERKVPVLNLGGGVRENDSIARAKQRFRPQRLELRALRQIYRPDVYARLCELMGEPEQTDGYFPAYRAHSLRGRPKA